MTSDDTGMVDEQQMGERVKRYIKDGHTGHTEYVLGTDYDSLLERRDRAEALLERIWVGEIPSRQLMQVVADWRTERDASKGNSK